jgi:hypothetical protein
MSTIYGMQRANGDWFTLEANGTRNMPLFHSIHDALMARLRHFGMLLFKPVMVDRLSLNQLSTSSLGRNLTFFFNDDPFSSLERQMKKGGSKVISSAGKEELQKAKK